MGQPIFLFCHKSPINATKKCGAGETCSRKMAHLICMTVMAGAQQSCGVGHPGEEAPHQLPVER